MARAYDVDAVERKWQRHWDDEGTYQIDNDDPREKFYALCMYPYPSGPAHQGHVRNYTFGDLAVRYQTMQGKGVLSPDRVRLLRPAGRERRHQDGHPSPDLHRGPDRRAQVVPDPPRAPSTTGAGRCAATTPSTSSGTSSIFLRLWEAGLAYRAMAPVNWCPGCQTVLANEQVLARRHLRALGRPRRTSATSSSGSSASPSTPTSCSTPSTTSSGPSGSRSCSATGSAAPRAPSSTSPSRAART